MSNRLVERWYSVKNAPRWLAPLSYLYCKLAERRRHSYISGRKSQFEADVPVLVVGNLSVGGTGKTPLTIALVEHLRAAGFKPGIVSRGYGAKPSYTPFHVLPDTHPKEGGDEPVMLAQRTGAPVVIDPNRPAAVRALLNEYDCNLVISDDGLQHYPLARDVEILVYDAARGLGNGQCLPAGPLREPRSRGELVDFIVRNGALEGGACLYDGLATKEFEMKLMPSVLVELHTRKRVALSDWKEMNIHAVAGIGHPERFFSALKTLGFTADPHSYEDHQAYTPDMFEAMQDKLIITTEKDAVKLESIGVKGWFLEVNAQLEDTFYSLLVEQLHQHAKIKLSGES